jgi:hypothetical protein
VFVEGPRRKLGVSKKRIDRRLLEAENKEAENKEAENKEAGRQEAKKRETQGRAPLHATGGADRSACPDRPRSFSPAHLAG